MRKLTHCLLGLSFVADCAGAQALSSWTWADVAGARATALAVMWRAGFDDDSDHEHGAARALVECRLERARAAVPGTTASGAQVFGDATVAFVLVDAADWSLGLRFCEVLVDEAMPVADDLIATAVARAALAADDGEWIYPGHVLACHARRALLEGAEARPVVGSATALQGLSSARVRELLRAPVVVACLGLGAVPDELRAAAATWATLSALASVRPRVAGVGARLPTGSPETRLHARIDGPFVDVAFAVAKSTPLPALAMAVEVAKARAARSLRLRGGEIAGRAPVVAWSWLHGEPLLQFFRRGSNGDDPLPATRELEALLADLCARPPDAQELAAARRALQNELAVPPWTPVMAEVLAAAPGALPGRAMVVLLAAHRGIDQASIAAVTGESAHAALVATCVPSAGWWGTLVPAALNAKPVGTSR